MSKGIAIFLCSLFVISGLVSVQPYSPVMSEPTTILVNDDVEFELSTDWTQSYGHSGEDVLYSLVETSDGGFVATGLTSSYGADGRDIWIIRVAADGTPMWNKTFGGSDWDAGLEIIEISSGGYAICGRTRISASNYFSLIKIDEDGNLDWYQNYTGNNDQSAYALDETDDGGFILVGGSYYSSDFYVVLVDENGTEVWDSSYYVGTYARANAVLSLGGSAGFIIAGTVENHSAGYGWDDFLLMKIDDAGVEQWNASYGGPDTEYCNDVIETDDGGYLLAGKTVSFGNGGFDAYIVKTGSAGEFEFSKTYGGSSHEGCSAITMTFDGGYAFVGYSSSDGAIGEDIWVVRTDSEYEPTWIELVQEAQDERAYGIVEVSDGGYAVCGSDQTDQDALIVRLSEPKWVQTPTNKELYFGDTFEYDVNASSTTGPASYFVNDTSNFSIDSNGVIRNATVLSVGYYGLLIEAVNMFGRVIKAEIEISVIWRYSNLKPTALGADTAKTVVETKDGGLVIIGSARNPVFGDGAPWIFRLDRTGNEVWSEVFGTRYWIRDILACSTGGYVAAGYSVDGLGYPLAGWLLKIDESGQHIWNATFNHPYMDYAESLIETPDGGFLLFGGTQEDSGEYDMWLIKTDSFGNHLWNKTFGAYDDNDGAGSIAMCAEGGYILAGFLTPSYKNTVLIRIDEDGNQLWNQTYPTSDQESPQSVIQLD
ncbi:MAG: hypothetical protein RTU92_13410, partial [Candidatus Thorarchaeota archaeon]